MLQFGADITNRMADTDGETSEPKTISVVGYSTCGYYHSACNVAKRFGEANNVKVMCKSMDRSQYKQWLSNHWTSGVVPSYHTTSPATFFGDVVDEQEGTKFIGGCDELKEYVRKQQVSGQQKSGEGCSIL